MCIGIRFSPVMVLGLISVSAICSCKLPTTPERTISIAHQYASFRWMPEEQHIRHGPDASGIRVDTPDVSLADYDDLKGYWKPGEVATGMPYKWGGFDTPEMFLVGLEQGKKAGDISGRLKRKLDQAGVSDESVGIDCSGFVSRCWNLDRAYSTRELPSICDRLDSWQELGMGDILLKDGHVVLFKEWDRDQKRIMGYEAGPFPKWRVNACGISVDRLKQEGYAPWRYRKMKNQRSKA